MKPKNFPARKNERRALALGKLMDIPLEKMTTAQRNEYDALMKSVTTPDTARAVRTKKARTARRRSNQ